MVCRSGELLLHHLQIPPPPNKHLEEMLSKMTMENTIKIDDDDLDVTIKVEESSESE